MDLRKKRILVTGGNGAFGINIIKLLIKSREVKPEDIVVFSRSKRGLEFILGSTHISGDIRSYNSLRQAAEGCQLVFHCAASTSMDPRVKKQQWEIISLKIIPYHISHSYR